jgi:ribosomal protein L23
MAENTDIKLQILEPRSTEKTYTEQTKRIYVFEMPTRASKQEIKKTIEKEFSVTVTDVNVLTRKGKATKFSRGRHAYPGTTYRRDRKYAYVKLKDGDSIKVFAEQEENNNTSAKDTAKAEKKGLFSRKKDAEDKNAGKEKE